MNAFNDAERRGISLVEFMVVISILGLLVALLLPALQAARETTRRTSCLNNLREQGSALLQFEAANGRLPSAGQGTDPTLSPPASAFEMRSAFAQMLPYLEEAYLTAEMNFDYAYNDAAWPNNQTAAKTIVPTYLCPSNAFRTPDPNGYGLTDYMPAIYSDIDLDNGVYEPLSRMEGAFRLGGMPAGKIIDGLSRTIALAEDAGRSFEAYFPNTISQSADPIFSGGSALVWNGKTQVTYAQWCAARGITSGGLAPGDGAPASGRRVMNRWAEPASSGGISGQPNSTPGNLINPINGNDAPVGGPPGCPWNQTNCGPNEEVWSWHLRGANVGMCDGSARFIYSKIDPRVLRRLVTADEQAPFSDNDVHE